MKHLVSIEINSKMIILLWFLPAFIVKNTAKFYFKLVEVNIYFFIILAPVCLRILYASVKY